MVCVWIFSKRYAGLEMLLISVFVLEKCLEVIHYWVLCAVFSVFGAVRACVFAGFIVCLFLMQ